MKDVKLTIDIIRALGGTNRIARMLKIKPPSVSAYKKNGFSGEKLLMLAASAERAGVIHRKDLRPDDWRLIWPELDEKAAEKAAEKADEKAENARAATLGLPEPAVPAPPRGGVPKPRRKGDPA